MPAKDADNNIMMDVDAEIGIEEIPAVDTQKEERNRILMALVKPLLDKRDIAVKAKTAQGIEKRMREDEISFDGMDAAANKTSVEMVDYAAGNAFLPVGGAEQRYKGSQIIANCSRSKCEVAWGRWCDMILPTDARNWDMDVTPIPGLSDHLKNDQPAAIAETNEPIMSQDGTPAMISDVVKSEMDEAKKRMEAMQLECDDQTTECNFNSELRKCAWDAIKLGTGILKGPSVVSKTKRTWNKQEDETGTVWVTETKEESKPIFSRVNPWDFFPDPECGENIKDSTFNWERGKISPRELSRLIKIDGYEADQIKLVLEEPPKKTAITLNRAQEIEISRTTSSIGGNYETWECECSIGREELEAIGCDCSHDEYSQALSACVLFANDRPIKIVLNTLDTGDMMYSVFQWTQISGSIWGLGITRIQLWWDRVLTMGWRAMLDNAADSAGSATVMDDDVEWAGDGKPRIGGKGVWRLGGDLDDVNKAFGQFQIANHQAELQKVIELALMFIEMETGIPRIFQGEQQKAPETLGATNILVDSSNITLRGKVKRWDDDIIVPAITRLYDWNMQYNEKDEIKGDCNVKALGSTSLIARDTQTRALGSVFGLMNDPYATTIIDRKKAYRLFFRNQQLDIIKTDDEIKQDEEKASQQQGQQQDPRVAGQIQVAQMRNQGEMEKAQLVQQSDMKELELKREIETASFQFKSDQAAQDRQLQLQLKQIDRELKIMELSQSSQQSIESIKAQLSETAMKLNVQKELSHGERQVVTPPTEPVQHAPNGRSYQE